MDQNGSIQMQSLYSDSCTIIEQARKQAYRAVNKALTIRNWSLGQRIAREHLGEDGRAEYGKHIIESLAEMLTDKYGKGFDQSSLYKYVRFYTLFPEILDALSPQSQKVDAVSQRLLPWTVYTFKRDFLHTTGLQLRNTAHATASASTRSA